MDLWAKAKSKIWHFEIQDYQLGKWFKENFGIQVGMADFEPPVPPDKFTSSMLSFFCDYVDLCCST